MTIAVFFFSMIGAMALGMPIAFALFVCGMAMMVFMGNWDVIIVAQNVLSGADSYPLMAIPFFVLAGELMNAGGLSQRIVRFAQAFVGHYRGGLGFVAIFTATIIASLSGSAIADTAAVAAFLMPMMRQSGYNMPRSAGLIASGGIIAPIIPPSIGMVMFGSIANVSIMKLFMSGIAPGLLMGFSLIATWAWVVRRDNLTSSPPMSWSQRWRACLNALWAMMMPIVIIGGLRSGVFTPTEAAVAATFYAFFVGTVVYREITLKSLYEAMLSASRTTAVIMFLVAAATVSSWLIAAANIPMEVAQLLKPFNDSPRMMMFVIMLLVVVVGTALDFAPTVLILTPVLMPSVMAAKIDPVYFGVMFIMNNAIGLLTPPVGTVLNVVAGIGNLNMADVSRGVLPFIIVLSALMFLMVLFPQIIIAPVTWWK